MMDSFKFWEQYATSCREMLTCMMEQTTQQSETFQKQVEQNVETMFSMWQPSANSASNPNELEDQPKPTDGQKENAPPVCSEPVWRFRGYQLEAGNFTNAMVHFFRAETYRADLWRRRLDTTTNWAVITTGATLSLTWDPRVIILSTLLVTLFLFIEARRYRYYEMWSYRVRLMETDFFAAMLVPPFQPAPDWAESLAENLLRPRFPISMWEAFGRRFRRNYIWIYAILWLAWLLSTWLHPTPVNDWIEFIERAAIGSVSAWLVLIVGILFNGALLLTGFFTKDMKQASGEVFTGYDDEAIAPVTDRKKSEKHGQPQPFHQRTWFRPSKPRKQCLAHIITTAPDKIASQILTRMGRGVTALNGKGMYSQQDRQVLMCALTVTELGQLKSLISQIDPQALLISSPVDEVYGAGFYPLQMET